MNGIFYSPRMIQLSGRPMVQAFKGKKMQQDDYSGFLNKINSKINDKTIPEFGIFPPVSADFVLNDDSCLVFQVRPSKDDTAKKIMEMNFINAQTKKISSRPKIYNNKKELLKFINSVDEKSLKDIVKNFKTSTK